ncbi:MAG: metallophosphoesterase [Oscillospiraceae bacterium]|nr:metallophosphoesterase [Oscillospiraceae bacterium]
MKKKTDKPRPNHKIKAFVDLMFDEIPYSPEASEAQPKIEKALGEQYDALCQEHNEGEALDLLLSEYGSLSKIAQLAGYTGEQALAWRNAGDAADLKTTKKLMRKQRRRTYMAALFSMFAFTELIWMIYNAVNLNAEFFFVTGMCAVFVLLALRRIRNLIKTERENRDAKYDNAAFSYLRALSDQYTKRLFNSVALLIGAAFVFIGSELSFYVFGNSKSAELAENFFSNMIMVEIPLFLLVKNLTLHRLIQKRIALPELKKAKKYGIFITILSLVFWVDVTLFTVIASRTISYPGNIFLAAGFVFAAIILLLDLTVRRSIAFRNLVFNPRRFAVVTAAVLLCSGFTLLNRDTWYTQSYINSVPVVEHNTHKIEYNDDTGVYTVTASTEDFKILHLTDIHIGGSLYSYNKDMKALKACFTEIEHTHPDLVIVTGDLCFPLGIMSMSLNNSAPVQQFAAFMRNTGIPWAFTYGNHDTETLSTLNKTELNEVYKSLSFKTSGNLLYPYVQPDIMGRNNQLIELRNSDGSMNTGLFLIDSNAYTGEGINVYDYIHDDQVDWYAGEVERMNAEAGHTVNSMVFFHIPLQEYKTATELYNAGSDEVRYFFGENPGDHGGITNDLVCCSDYPSKMFDTALELGSTTGFFCGHDHYNNASLEYKGIRLTYGMSIDYLAMPGIAKETKQRGAELITIHSDSTWDLEQIPLTSIT